MMTSWLRNLDDLTEYDMTTDAPRLPRHLCWPVEGRQAHWLRLWFKYNWIDAIPFSEPMEDEDDEV